jgi:hypothetical protein
MMDQEDDNYNVEHEANFVLNKEQFRKLIEAKFSRSRQYARQVKERESRLKYVDE